MQSFINKPPELAGTGVQSREVRYRDHRIHYLTAGSGGPPLVLVHGGASDCTDWVPTMSALSDRFTMYAPDLPGFGRSDRRETGYYLTDFFEFLEEFVSLMGVERTALVGHSFGARVCLGVALERPDLVSRLVMVDGAGLGKTSWFGVALLTAFDKARQLLHKPLLNPTFLTREGDDPDWACVEDLPKLRVPTLLIWRQRDPYLPLDNARRAVDLIPDARLEIMPGLGHAPHRTYADAFYRLVREFLDGTGVSPAE